jgi:hypothetical protein
VRLALEFNSTTARSRTSEREQVEKHLRVCIKVDAGLETAVTVAPSEPIVAEGSRLLMSRDNFNLPRSLLDVLQGPSLDKGDRGELICLVLWVLACDALVNAAIAKGIPDPCVVSVVDLLKSLLATRYHDKVMDAKPSQVRATEEDIPFCETFQDAKVYFNHFIKITDTGVINRKFLWAVQARGAAILCANNQRGIDVLIPVVYRDAKLGRLNITVMIIQVKNDKTFTAAPKRAIFANMNPYYLHIFDKEDQPLPIVRMVFALASPTADVVVVNHLSPRRGPPRRAKKSKAAPCFTAYDIWCAGTSSETFQVVKPTEHDVYSSLLKLSRTFPQAYEAAQYENTTFEALRRRMHPSTSLHPDHWSFITGLGGSIDEELAYYDEYEEDELDNDEEIV